MKNTRILASIASLALLSSMPVLNAQAASIAQDGLNICLTTDKDSYALTDTVFTKITVTNDSDASVYDVQLENLIPGGYTLLTGSDKSGVIAELPAGESVELEAGFAYGSPIPGQIRKSSKGLRYELNPVTPPPAYISNALPTGASPADVAAAGSTGSTSGSSAPSGGASNSAAASSPSTGAKSVVPYVAAALASAVLIVTTRRSRKGRQIFSLMLCGSVLLATIPFTSLRVDAADLRNETANITVKVNVGGEDVAVKAKVAYKVEDRPANELILRSDSNTVLADGSNKVNFYLETNFDTPSVTLYYGTEGTLDQTAVMYDNGSGADDIAGDGVYSVSLVPSVTEDTVMHFAAKTAEGDSNEITVRYYVPISDTEFDAMEQVDKELDELIATDAYMEKAEKEKLAAVMDKLKDFESRNLIMKNSIYSDEKHTMVSFLYLGDIMGGISYGDSDEDEEEGDCRNGAAPVRAGDALEMNADLPTVSINADPTIVAEADGIEEIGSAIILNSFPGYETEQAKIDYRTDFYNTLDTAWDNAGLSTTVKVDPTLDDYRQLGSYNVICISTHGTVYSDSKTECPAICLSQSVGKIMDKKYSAELKDKQIARVNGNYWILPSFIEKQYDADAFANAFVFSECCCALGDGNGSNTAQYDTSMADAFINRGAKGYVGFHNSVWADYSREFMEHYVNRLIEGDTSKAAFDFSVNEMGANHEIWYERTHSHTHQEYYEKIKKDPEVYDPDFHIAYPVLMGNEEAVLVDTNIRNGGFEECSAKTTAPKYWDCMGDVRTLNKLGEVTPYGTISKRMAIVTSGIGASSSTKFGNGTEGSALSQSFVVPKDASRLCFHYNFVSEEPMEYVGSIYDDSFAVQLKSEGKVAFDKTFESINSSKWTAVKDVNFIGGDSTAFQTGWKTGEIDVSAYRGRRVTLSFIIYDVGDQVFDSACLIDNVTLK